LNSSDIVSSLAKRCACVCEEVSWSDFGVVQ
jgi:hypothetical protein